MASKSVTVYLGYIDEQISKKNQHFVNGFTSKIGGAPSWVVVGCQSPSCTRCKRRMLLVIQLYAPLEGNLYHRTLYVFACITPECWNRPHSWLCLRGQLLETKPDVSAKKSSSSTNEMWMEGEDDWGGSSDNEDNGNVVNEEMPLNNSLTQKTFTEETPKRNLNELQAASISPTVVEVTKSIEKNLNLNEGDSNANDSACGGAVAYQGHALEGLEASAMIEGPEGDMIALESPQQQITDIPALFKEATRVEPTPEIHFNSFFLSSAAEPLENTNFLDHEKELLQKYTLETGHELFDKASGGGMNDGDGLYEKSTAHHGDILMHKFQKRISRSPSQILRYCRDDSSIPLWLHPPKRSEMPSKCAYCNGRLVFEAQIMPQLVSKLRVNCVSGPQNAVLEFGTVVIYTCSASCWKEGDATRQEYLVVQGEENY